MTITPVELIVIELKSVESYPIQPFDFQENFEGPSVRVPDLEGALYQKESGKRKWNQRYFLLRASGIYYIPKGKTKVEPILYK